MSKDSMNSGLRLKLQRLERHGRLRLVCSLAFAVAGIASLSQAHATQSASPAAIPKVFIANAGGDFGRDNTDFPAVGDGAYNKFFAGIKDWGEYEIVANPAMADWVFEISASDLQTCIEQPRRDGGTHLQHDYRIKLVMMNGPGTPAVRKPFIERLRPPGLLSSPGQVFDRAIASLIDDAKIAAGRPAPDKTSLKNQAAFMAPIPPKIGAARKVFIDYADAGNISGERYSDPAPEVYNQLAAAIEGWGRYEVVATAGQADLVFRVSFTMQPPCNNLGDPMFNLLILDAKTDVALWGISTHVEPALLTRNAHKNFATGITQLVGSVREVAERPTWLLDASAPATAPSPTAGPAAATPGALNARVATLPPIPVTISPVSKVVKPGSEARINVTVRNTSKQALDFTYPAGDPLTCLTVVREANGNVASDTEEGRRLKAAHAGWQGRALAYNLQPGETQNRECAIGELYDMSRPGQYSIQVEQLDGRPVESNTVAVTVAP